MAACAAAFLILLMKNPIDRLVAEYDGFISRFKVQ